MLRCRSCFTSFWLVELISLVLSCSCLFVSVCQFVCWVKVALAPAPPSRPLVLEEDPRIAFQFGFGVRPRLLFHFASRSQQNGLWVCLFGWFPACFCCCLCLLLSWLGNLQFLCNDLLWCLLSYRDRGNVCLFQAMKHACKQTNWQTKRSNNPSNLRASQRTDQHPYVPIGTAGTAPLTSRWLQSSFVHELGKGSLHSVRIFYGNFWQLLNLTYGYFLNMMYSLVVGLGS